jgi:hypothetical protein
MTARTLSAILATGIVLALAACGGDDTAAPAAPPSPPPSAPPATTEAPPEPTTESSPPVTEPETSAETTETDAGTETEAEAEPVVIQVEGGEPVGGEETITVKQGDTVRIRVEVDEPQEIHLHGYELEQEATPEEPAVFEFTAEIEGIFDLETHLTDAKLAKLVVEP